MGMKEAYQDQLKAQLREWNADIEKLKAKVDKSDAKSRVKYYEEIEGLRARRNVAEDKLRAMEAAGAEQWESLKADVDKAFDSMRDSIKRVSSKISGT